MLKPSKNAYNKYRKSMITRNVSSNGRLFQMVYLTTQKHDPPLTMEANARKFSPPLFYNPAINANETTIATATGGETLSPPAVIDIQNKNYIFWTSAGSCFYSMITNDAPSNPVTLPIQNGNFTTTPGIRVFNNQVHLVWSDTNNNIQYAVASVNAIDSNWSVTQVATGAASDETPAVIAEPQTNNPVIFYRNDQKQVFSVSPGGSSSAITLDGAPLTSELSVSACLYKDAIWLACSGEYISAGTIDLQNSTLTLKQTFEYAPRLAETEDALSLTTVDNSLFLSWILREKETVEQAVDRKKITKRKITERRAYLMLTQDGEFWQSRQPVYSKINQPDSGNPTLSPMTGNLSPQAVAGDIAQIHYSYLKHKDQENPDSIMLVSCSQNNLSEGSAPQERAYIPWFLNDDQTPSTNGEIATGGGDNPLLRGGFLTSALCMEYLHDPRFASGLHYAEKMFEYYEESELLSDQGEPTGFFMRRSNYFNKHSYNRPASGDEITGLILGLLRLYMAFIQVPEKKDLLDRIVAMTDRLGTFLKENFYLLFPPLNSEIKDPEWPYGDFLGQYALVTSQYPIKSFLQKVTGKTYNSSLIDIINTVIRLFENLEHQNKLVKRIRPSHHAPASKSTTGDAAPASKTTTDDAASPSDTATAHAETTSASARSGSSTEAASFLKMISASGLLKGDEAEEARKKLEENNELFKDADISGLIPGLPEIKAELYKFDELKPVLKDIESLLGDLIECLFKPGICIYSLLIDIMKLLNDLYYNPLVPQSLKDKIAGSWFNNTLLQHSFFMALDLNAETKAGSILYAGQTHNVEHLYMAWADTKDKQRYYFARSFNGQFWQYKFSKKLDILNNTIPAACFFNERHYVFYINKSKQIAGLSISPEGVSENISLPSQGKLTQSQYSPSVTTTNDAIYVALSNQTSQATITLLVYKNANWQTPQEVNGITNVKGKPALAFSKDSGKIALAWYLKGFWIFNNAEFYVALLNNPDTAPATSQKATVQGAYPNPESFQIAPAKENFTVVWGNTSKKIMYTTYAGKSATLDGRPIMDQSRQMQYRWPFGLTGKSSGVFLSAAPKSSGVINIYSQSSNSWPLILSCDSEELGNRMSSYLESFLINPRTKKIRNADLYASSIVRFLQSQMIQIDFSNDVDKTIDLAAISMQPDCPVAEPQLFSKWSQWKGVPRYATYSWINKAPVQAHNTQTFSLGDALIGTDFCWEKGPNDNLRILSFAPTNPCRVNTLCPDTGVSGTCPTDEINNCLLSILYAGNGPDYDDTFIQGCGLDYLYPRAVLGFYDPQAPFEEVDQTLYPVLPNKDCRPVYPDFPYDPNAVQSCANGCKDDKP